MLCSTFGVFWGDWEEDFILLTVCLEAFLAYQAPIDFFSEKLL